MKKLKLTIKKLLSIVLVVSLINFDGLFDYKKINLVYANENDLVSENINVENQKSDETYIDSETTDYATLDTTKEIEQFGVENIEDEKIVDSENNANIYESSKMSDIKSDDLKDDNKDIVEENIVELTNNIESDDEVKETDVETETNKKDNINKNSEIDEINENADVDFIIDNSIDFDKNKLGISTKEIDIDGYKDLDLIEQILKSSNNVKKEDENIILTDDIILKYPLYINGDYNKLFLNGFTITAPENSFAIWTNQEFYLDGSSPHNEDNDDVKKIGSIVGNNYKNFVIYTEYTNVFISNISIYGSNVGGNGIFLVDSNLTIDNAYIYGGKGERVDGDIGGIGGNAIVVDYKTNDYIIEYKSGIIKGGDGGDGYSDIAEGSGGSSVQLGMLHYSDNENLIEGALGDYGGGDGGVGIQYINQTTSMSFINVNDNLIIGGSGGNSTKKNKKREKKKLGSSNLPTSFDLRKQTNENGVVHSLVASLHDQKGTGLCNTFTTIATAENFLLKNHPEKVEEMGYAPIFQYTKNFPTEQRGVYTWTVKENDKDVEKSVSLSTLGVYENELDLSEAHLAYFLRYHTDDPLGNAGKSSAAPNKAGVRFFNVGSTKHEIPMFLAPFRPIVSEKVQSSQVMTDVINEVIKKQAESGGDELSDAEEGTGIAMGDKIWTTDDVIDRNKNYEPAVILKSAKIVQSSASRKNEFLNELKETVYKKGATALVGNFRYWTKNEFNCVDGTFDGEKNSLMNIPAYNSGGHAVTVIGWDDNYPAKNFKDTVSKYYSNYLSAYNFLEPENDGALLVKQSTNGPAWTWIYYDSVFDANWNFISYEWMLPETYYDNNYYYDGGTAATYYQTSQTQVDFIKLANVFEIKNDNEKATAVSFVSADNIEVLEDSEKPRVQIYKTSGLDNAKKEGDYLVDKPVNLFEGLNFIELDEAIELEKGQTYGICMDFSNVDMSLHKEFFVDATTESDKTTYNTTPAHRTYSCVRLKVGNNAGKSGWSSTYFSGGEVLKNYNIRIKLITSNNVKVNFNANGGSFGNSDVISERRLYGEKILKDTIKTPTYNGYKFLGWSDKNNSQTPNINENDIFLFKSEKTYYGVWEPESTGEKYKATFNANGGKFVGGTESYEKEYTIDSNINAGDLIAPTKTGYRFLGYSENGNSPATIIAGSKWNYTENKTFYAIWEIINYKAVFSANGGSFAGGSESYEKEYTVESYINAGDLIAPTKTGYRFLGYSENGNNPTTITVGSKWNYTENKTFYAIWEIINYKAVFNANGGSFAGGTESYEKEYTVESYINAGDLVAPTKTGYRFLGYSENGNNPATITAGSKWNYTENKTFYAIWEIINYKAVFSANGGSFAGGSESYEKEYTVESYINAGDLIAPTKSGYRFLGYSENGNNPATIITGTKWTYTTNKTFYAIWEIINYKAVFNANGGKFASGTESYEKEYTVDSYINAGDLVAPTKSGYRFLGYSQNGNNPATITVGSKWNYTENKTFYAIWEFIDNEEESSTEPSSTEPSSTEPAPTEPSSTEPAPTEPSSTEPSSTEPSSTEPAPTEPSSTEPAPTEPSSTESSKVEPSETTKQAYTYQRTNNGGGSSSGGKNTINIFRSSGDTVGQVVPNQLGNNIISPIDNQTSVLVAPPESAEISEVVNTLPKDDSANTAVKTTSVNQIGIRLSKMSDVMAWGYDINTNNWNLTVVNNGAFESIKNTFYVNEQSAITNSNKLPDAYYLDNNGNLVTGWIKDSSGNSFYMEPKQGSEFGKLQRGWKEIEGNWYYFQADGRLVKNTITPDGYYVNENGLYIET